MIITLYQYFCWFAQHGVFVASNVASPTTEAIMQLCLSVHKITAFYLPRTTRFVWAGNILKQLCTFVQHAYVCLCVLTVSRKMYKWLN